MEQMTTVLLDEAKYMLNKILHDETYFKNFLNVCSYNSRYSINNVCLIQFNDKNATKVGSKDYWEKQGYSLNERAKGMNIIEPIIENGYTTKDFRVKTFYNITDTNCPEAKKEDDKTIVSKLLKIFEDRIVIKQDQTNTKSVYFDNHINKFTFLTGHSPKNHIKDFIHEATVLHINNEMNGEISEKDKQFIANSASYMFGNRHGIINTDFSFTNMKEYFNGDNGIHKLQNIKNTYHHVCENINRSYNKGREKAKETGKIR